MESEKVLEYFSGDELAANVWKSKYALEGEETPDDMHKRLAKEFTRIETHYRNSDITKRLENKDKTLCALDNDFTINDYIIHNFNNKMLESKIKAS